MSPRAEKPESDQSQALLYANDIARLYRRVREHEQRVRGHEARLGDLVRFSVDLVEAVSAEAAAQRILDHLGRLTGAARIAVFAARGSRFRPLAVRGGDPVRTAFAREDLGTAESPDLSVLKDLGLGEPLAKLALRGRSGQVVGFAAAAPAAVPAEGDQALELFARLSGVHLEAHLLEEARANLRQGRLSSTTTARPEPLASLVGESPPLQRVRELVRRVAPVMTPVLVLGETGTGKELVARAVHDASPRRRGPFVAVNCGALPESLVESEIFGHEAGAFTGANKRQKGKIEQAQGGTLFLDELGEMPKAAQVKLLRFLQDSRYTPIGAEGERTADVRIVAATNKDIERAMAKGELRSDLVFRLNVFSIELPPLRDRGDDVVVLARAFARETAERHGRPPCTPNAAAEAALRAYDWPGNVRELRNVIERAVLLCEDGTIEAGQIPRRAGVPGPVGSTAVATVVAPSEMSLESLLPTGAFQGELVPFAEAKAQLLARFEAVYCEAALARAGGNIARAARLAKIDKKNLHRKIRTLGLDPSAHKR
jgi:two-component system nitrogen regulation response regulator GlnG